MKSSNSSSTISTIIKTSMVVVVVVGEDPGSGYLGGQTSKGHKRTGGH